MNQLFQNQPIMYNPDHFMANYPFNLNFNYNLNFLGMPNFMPTFTPMLSTLSQFPNYGCFPQQMPNNALQYPYQNFQKNL